jgi:hypothetical protein
VGHKKDVSNEISGPQEKLWTAPKGKLVALMIHKYHLFLVPTETLELKDQKAPEKCLIR